MTRYTVAWALWAAAFVVIELAAHRAGYAQTLSGHLVRAMLAHPVIAVVVIGASCALTAHLAIDFLTLKLK